MHKRKTCNKFPSLEREGDRKAARMQKLTKGKFAKRSSFLERKGGPPAKSWRGIVDTTLFGCRKEC